MHTWPPGCHTGGRKRINELKCQLTQATTALGYCSGPATYCIDLGAVHFCCCAADNPAVYYRPLGAALLR
eukprot:1516515-Pyramimonas_sp.AAC.3